jgi:hypothetical protein
MSLVDAFAKIFELINKLLEVQTRRRREIFSELLEPLFHRIEEVHSFYRELFTKAWLSLPYQRDNGAWEMPNANSHTLTNIDIIKRVNKIKREFIEGREKDIYIRDQLRNNAREILISQRRPVEKRFLFSIILYFLEAEPYVGDFNAPPGSADYFSIDLFMKEIEEEGGVLALRTPSSILANYIYPKKDPVELKRIIKGALYSLDKKFINVSNSFIRIKLDVFENT